MADASNALLTDLLKQVSRSFYLTLRVLPPAVRPQIGLAYLLARTSDTIADTEILPPEARLEALGLLRARISGQRTSPLSFSELAQHQGSPAERTLLECVEHSITLLQALSAEDLELVRRTVDTITSGQELDLRRFARTDVAPNNPWQKRNPIDAAHEAGRATKAVIALQSTAELDDYTYRVAGCVGEFWTRMCRAHLFPEAALDDARLLEDGVRFGKGLQLVNILRDLPRDLQQGRCYIPSDLLSSCGLRADDLLDPASEGRLRTVYDSLLGQAEAHLAAGWTYTNAIPANQWRVRLACAWPILIGVRTVELLRTGSVLAPSRNIKVTRSEVRRLMVRSVLRVPFPGRFSRLWMPGGR